MDEAELLFIEALNCRRIDLYQPKDKPLGREASSYIAGVLRQRIQGVPIQYILGKAEFMGLEFFLDRNVFIPRPETEILVESVIKYSKTLRSSSLKILDIGTGSACIAVSLGKFLEAKNILATDINEEALNIARLNARRNSVKINFLNSNLFDNKLIKQGTFDIIVSNPPYIASKEIDFLEREVKCEPRTALDGGKDGLFFYRKIIKASGDYLRKGGLLFLEIGFGQINKVIKILEGTRGLCLVKVVNDYAQIPRVLIARKKER